MNEWTNPFEKFLPSKNYVELTTLNPIIPKGYIQIVHDIQDGKIESLEIEVKEWERWEWI